MPDHTYTEWGGFMSKIHKECGYDHGIEMEVEALIQKLKQALELKVQPLLASPISRKIYQEGPESSRFEDPGFPKSLRN